MLAKLFKESNGGQNRHYSTDTLMFALEHFDNTVMNFEELSGAIEETEALEEIVTELKDNGNVTSVELFMVHSRLKNLGESLGLDSVAVSLEDASNDTDQFLTASMEAVSGIWNRIKQLYVADFQQMLDAWGQLFSTAEGWGRRQQARIHRLRQEWKDKKPSLNEKRHKSSLAGSSLPILFTVKGRPSTNPVDDLDTDYGFAKYISNQYPKDLALYLEKVRSILNSGDFSRDEKFESSVVSKISKLDHPYTVFKGKGVGAGNILLGNRGLEVWKGRTVKPVSNEKEHLALADLCVKTHVREFAFTWSDFNSSVLEDFYFTTEEVDKMLDHADRYCQLIIDAKTGFTPLTKAYRNLANSTKKMNDIESLSANNRKVFKQIISFTRGLTRYSKTPYRFELGRIMNLVPGIRVLASRTIATSK